jgi:hypothetical protein
LGTHHESEDQIAFPAFQQVIPSAPYARLTADHQKIESRLTKTPIWIKDLSGENSEFALRELMNILREISRLWIPHIMVEEEYFAQEALNAVMSPEEQGRIGTAASQYSQEHSGPPYWVVPFILYNLELDERKIMAANFPPTIMDELVPKVWKDQWTPMKPYLLD